LTHLVAHGLRIHRCITVTAPTPLGSGLPPVNRASAWSVLKASGGTDLNKRFPEGINRIATSVAIGTNCVAKSGSPRVRSSNKIDGSEERSLAVAVALKARPSQAGVIMETTAARPLTTSEDVATGRQGD
jgi:hypothetical protein